MGYIGCRQYALGPRHVCGELGWLGAQIGQGLHLSYSADMRVQLLTTKDAVQVAVLGEVHSCLPGSIRDHIASVDFPGLADLSTTFAGKWAILSETLCIGDASGMLGLYYRRVDGELWLSNSTLVLGEVVNPSDVAEPIDWKVSRQGINWIPAPFSTRAGVYKLLSGRLINPRTGAISHLKQLAADGPSLEEVLPAIMRNWLDAGVDTKLVSLTAGLDTRTMLAAASHASGDVATYTVQTGMLDKADSTLPPLLARRLGFSHMFWPIEKLGNAEVQRRKVAGDKQVDGIHIHAMASHFATGRLPGSPTDNVAVGLTFEVGRCYFWDKLPREVPTAEQLLDIFFDTPPQPYEAWLGAMRIWIESLKEPVPLDMDWRDRFYLEQRLGAWACMVQSAADLAGAVRFYPGNNLWVFRALLQAPPSARKSGAPQLDLIRTLAPQVASVPINPTSLLHKVRKTLGRVRRHLKMT